MPIVANFVVRNEAEKWLRPVLERVANQVDMICVTDDCSTDNTVEIAREFTANIQVMPEPTFSTHEGKLRQRSWEFLEQHVDTHDDWWVLAIDADEMLYETRYPLRDLTAQKKFDVLSIEFYHMWSPTHFRIDKAWRPHPSSRLFRYYPGGSFLDRALACGSEPTYVRDLIMEGRYFSTTGLIMKHLSYMTEEGKQSKYDRYTKIDGGAFHANAHIESIIDKDPVLVEWTYE